MNENRGVSVVIPAYNVGSVVSRAVESALTQDPQPHEVIIINDGSTDNTASMVKSFGDRIIYLEQQNQGQGIARNTGLMVCSGRYIAFLDADDYWLPGFIEATTKFLEGNPDAVAVSTGWKTKSINGQVKIFPQSDDYKFPKDPFVLDNFFDFWAEFKHIHTGTVLLRRSLIDQNALFKVGLRMIEDLEYWAYLATFGKWGFIPDVCWVGDSSNVTARSGWLKKYKRRRKLCPSMEEWQERIVSRLTNDDWEGYKLIRGYVAGNMARNLALGGQSLESRNTIDQYGPEMPATWSSRLLRLGHRHGDFTWKIACKMVHLREYQKDLFYHVLSLKE